MKSPDYPWEDQEFYQTRWVTDDETSNSVAKQRLVLHSPEGDAALVIQDQELEARRERAGVVEQDSIWLTPDEVLWLYEQLKGLVESK